MKLSEFCPPEILQVYIEKGLVNVHKNEDGLTGYCYTQSVYKLDPSEWKSELSVLRGLVVDEEDNIVAFPYRKFWEYRENTNLNDIRSVWELSEKIDGSLIIVFLYNGKLYTKTKSSFDSWQALRALKILGQCPHVFQEGYTYLFEYVSPENQIVVYYPKETLYFLDIIKISGEEKPKLITGSEIRLRTRLLLENTFGTDVIKVPFRKVFPSLEIALSFPVQPLSEGYVLKALETDPPIMFKLKTEEYKIIHSVFSLSLIHI